MRVYATILCWLNVCDDWQVNRIKLLIVSHFNAFLLLYWFNRIFQSSSSFICFSNNVRLRLLFALHWFIVDSRRWIEAIQWKVVYFDENKDFCFCFVSYRNHFIWPDFIIVMRKLLPFPHLFDIFLNTFTRKLQICIDRSLHQSSIDRLNHHRNITNRNNNS